MRREEAFALQKVNESLEKKDEEDEGGDLEVSNARATEIAAK